MFALLGDIRFDVITYFDSFTSRCGADFVEHALIAGKPQLQFMGDTLDEIRIELSFHQQFCNPEYELQRLKEAKEAHQAMALVLGNGDYKGWFVLAELNTRSKQTDNKGSLIALEADILLREFVGEKASAKPAVAIQLAQPPLTAKKLTTKIRAKFVFGTDYTHAVVTYIYHAKLAVDIAADTLNFSLGLKSNPASVLHQIPKLQDQFKPLSIAPPAKNDESPHTPEINKIAEINREIFTIGCRAQEILASATIDNVIANVDKIAHLNFGLTMAFEDLIPTLRPWIAKFIVRQGR